MSIALELELESTAPISAVMVEVVAVATPMEEAETAEGAAVSEAVTESVVSISEDCCTTDDERLLNKE
jgi:hypothetical protein